jgi:hypothetical protein
MSRFQSIFQAPRLLAFPQMLFLNSGAPPPSECHFKSSALGSGEARSTFWGGRQSESQHRLLVEFDHRDAWDLLALGAWRHRNSYDFAEPHRRRSKPNI